MCNIKYLPYVLLWMTGAHEKFLESRTFNFKLQNLSLLEHPSLSRSVGGQAEDSRIRKMFVFVCMTV
jgi:hypothetical protein